MQEQKKPETPKPPEKYLIEDFENWRNTGKIFCPLCFVNGCPHCKISKHCVHKCHHNSEDKKKIQCQMCTNLSNKNSDELSEHYLYDINCKCMNLITDQDSTFASNI